MGFSPHPRQRKTLAGLFFNCYFLFAIFICYFIRIFGLDTRLNNTISS